MNKCSLIKHGTELLFYIFGDQKGNVLGLTFVENIRNKKLG